MNAGGIGWADLELRTSTDRVTMLADYWAAVTGWAATDMGGWWALVPHDADAYVTVGPAASPGVGLRLFTRDPDAFSGRAAELGARRSPDGCVRDVTTPAGLRVRIGRFTELRRRPAMHARGQSLLDQVCLDVRAEDFEQECRFWAAWTGWEPSFGISPEFVPLQRPRHLPLRVILQRVEDDRRPATAHIDLASADRQREVAHHVQVLSGRVHREHDHFTVLVDPGGLDYCVTDRDPTTGAL